MLPIPDNLSTINLLSLITFRDVPVVSSMDESDEVLSFPCNVKVAPSPMLMVSKPVSAAVARSRVMERFESFSVACRLALSILMVANVPL